MNLCIRDSVVLIGILLCCVCAANTGTLTHAASQTATKISSSGVISAPNVNLDLWQADDTQYLAARSRIDGQLSNASFGKKVAAYRAVAEQEPSNPLAAFEWAYAAWQYGVTNDDDTYLRSLQAAIQSMLKYKPLPATYNCARVTFLWECEGNPDTTLSGAGEKFLHRDPNDISVMLQLADLYSWKLSAKNVALKERAIRLCNSALKLRPGCGIAYGDLSDIYHYSISSCDGYVDGKLVSPATRADMLHELDALNYIANHTKHQDVRQSCLTQIRYYTNILK